MTNFPISVAGQLNENCACAFLDRARLQAELEADPLLAGLAQEIAATRPHLFSSTMVFITPAQAEGMRAIVRAVEDIVARPAWQEQALARAPSIARLDPGPRGAFLGYDFHLGDDGPQLIEINTNAGGALLNSALARAQKACCREVEPLLEAPTSLASLDSTLLEMFLAEWLLQRGEGKPRRIAIVDDAPAEQYLYPEFRLFARLFERAGMRAAIAEPASLQFTAGRLLFDGEPVDLVYNRLTDFYLEAPEHAALREAYEAGTTVLTPHPRAHALYADKRNLALLSDDTALAALGVTSAERATLTKGVPRTRLVTAADADALWAERKQLFFKPATGFGSRAAYRGDKLTRRVWSEILRGDYVAQRVAPPSERVVCQDGATSGLKLDLRAYAYAGAVQLFAARLYTGQTTNFRTPGGGFAPVFVVPG